VKNQKKCDKGKLDKGGMGKKEYKKGNIGPKKDR